MLAVPVNNCIQYENTNQRADDIQNDVRPQTVDVDIPEIHPERKTNIRVRRETFENVLEVTSLVFLL